MIGCEEILSLIAGTPRGTLMPVGAKRLLYDHFEACRACRDSFATVVAVGSCLASSVKEAPTRLTEAEIAARVRAGIGVAVAS